MEFVIEEMPEKTKRALSSTGLGSVFQSMQRLMRQMIRRVKRCFLTMMTRIGRLSLSAYLREAVRIEQWSIKRELWGMSVLTGIVVLGLMGRDLLHDWKVQSSILEDRQTLTLLTQQQRQLNDQAHPIIEVLQTDWLRQYGGDLQLLMQLLLQLKVYFEDQLLLTKIEKRSGDESFSIEGRVIGFEGVFQLEPFLQARGWLATIAFEDQGNREKRFKMTLMWGGKPSHERKSPYASEKMNTTALIGQE